MLLQHLQASVDIANLEHDHGLVDLMFQRGLKILDIESLSLNSAMMRASSPGRSGTPTPITSVSRAMKPASLSKRRASSDCSATMRKMPKSAVSAIERRKG